MLCPPQTASLGEWRSSEQVCRLAAAAVETSLEFTARMQELRALLVTCAIERDQGSLCGKALSCQCPGLQKQQDRLLIHPLPLCILALVGSLEPLNTGDAQDSF